MRAKISFLTCLALIACGPPTTPSGGGGGGGGGGGAATLEGAVDQIMEARCNIPRNCDTAKMALMRQFLFELAGDESVYLFGDPAVCLQRSAASARAELQALTDAGRVTVELSRAGACARAIAASCDLSSDYPAECDSFLVPNQDVGQACGADQECVTGACSAEAGQCGECINLSGSGEPCSRQQPCAEGLQCDVELETCQQATPAVGTGQACESSFDSGTLGGNCANPNDLCINEVCTTVQLAAPGQACGETNQKLCAVGSVCINDLCVSEAAEVGATCAVPDGDDEMRRSALCPLDARCDTLTASCVALSAEGASCSGDAQCTNGSYCSGGVCSPKEALEQDCDEDSECASDTCSDGLCVEAVALSCD
ncbi:MAG: hypothetical protein VYB65_09000 [Myxococcota bacterium]|nr:hypothetical protein [Myxococcota bacterium]